jgi:exopolysaccharide biosynthesis WecB/TagA/CpsF family protein
VTLEPTKQSRAAMVGDFSEKLTLSSQEALYGAAHISIRLLGVVIMQHVKTSGRESRIEKLKTGHGDIVFVGIKKHEAERLLLQSFRRVREHPHSKLHIVEVPEPSLHELNAGVPKTRVATARKSAKCIEKIEPALRKLLVQELAAEAPMHTNLGDCARNTEALHDAEFGRILNGASLVVPDGYPLVVLGRRNGFPLARRVYGPELLQAFCEETARKGYRHFFYGGAAGVADDLASRFAGRFPGMQIAGTYCPPFRPLTPAEEQDVCEKIKSSRADVVWVGLSTPKQERWMASHREALSVPVMVGVGAAFDFHTGAWRRLQSGCAKMEWSGSSG